jgi:hypothetical protein
MSVFEKFIFYSLLCITLACNQTQQGEDYIPLYYPIEVNGKVGLIDTSGQIIMEPTYLNAQPLGKDVFLIEDSKGKRMVNNQGLVLLEIPSNSMPLDFNGEWIKIDEIEHDTVFFFDLDGQKRLAISKQGISHVSGNFDECNRLLVVLSEGKFLYLNKKGERVFSISGGIPSSFDTKSRLARIIYTKKTCYYDTLGQVKFCIPGEGSEFAERFALIEHNGKKYFINQSGKKNVDVSQYGYVSPWFQDDLALVIKGNFQGYIDSKGNVVIPLIYSQISRFTLGLATAQDSKDDKWIIINRQNQVVSDKRFDWLDREGYFGYLCRASTGDTTGWINRKGQFVWVDPD